MKTESNSGRHPYRIRKAPWLAGAMVALIGLGLACSSTDSDGSSGGSPSVSGSGGSKPSSGGAVSGGATNTGGAATGGIVQGTGGSLSSGGFAPTTGGSLSSGGFAPTTGGSSTGGRATTGGTSAASGGIAGSSTFATGGRNGSGGNSGNGGRSSQGGSAGRSSGGGSGGTASGGSGGGTGAFQPCPTNGDPCKILPLGDSITWGIQYDGAYRVELFTKAVAAGQKITFTGSLSNGPSTVSGQTFPKNNEGHSGWTIQQDTGLVPSPAFNTIPNIVLLMIGTNDIYASSGQATMPDRLGTLIDKIISTAPNALLVVGKITPLSNASWNTTIKTYNDAIPGVVQTRVAAGKHVMVVDLNTGFTTSMLSSDGVHPNKSGYDFMGDVWYAAIKDYLPK